MKVRAATNHQIKQAMIRLMNEFIGSEVKVQYMGVGEFNDSIWLTHSGHNIIMIPANKDISVNVTKAILAIRKGEYCEPF